jgi:hypothetical protein
MRAGSAVYSLVSSLTPALAGWTPWRTSCAKRREKVYNPKAEFLNFGKKVAEKLLS